MAACPTPSASCGDAQLGQWVKRQLHLAGGQKWVQTQGQETVAVTDDIFSLAPDVATAANAQDTAANTFIEIEPPPLPKPARPLPPLQAFLHNGRVFFAFLGVALCTGCYCFATHSMEHGGTTTAGEDSDEAETPRNGSRASNERASLVDARELGWKLVDSRAMKAMP
eukprot:SRR837773.9189.p4 GENE.SRR837773.9189~~SRR837773.9189.p4  ORF type:complete len:168 (+),score=62.97 SRR837773.9189:583-1086(+)